MMAREKKGPERNDILRKPAVKVLKVGGGLGGTLGKERKDLPRVTKKEVKQGKCQDKVT